MFYSKHLYFLKKNRGDQEQGSQHLMYGLHTLDSHKYL